MNFARLVSTVAAVMLAAACGKNPEPAEQSKEAERPSTSTHDVTDSTSSFPSPGSLGDLPAAPSSPWSAPAIPASSVPRVYSVVWRAAENRSRCALIAPVALDSGVIGAAPRKATFSGGWSVAYDLPGLRSAFGVAGSGSDAWSSDTYAQWPHNISWPDGSSAGYGPEGGTGTNWLAYVKIPGQQCLYNVWSRRGQGHLEQLIHSLRFVTDSAG